MGDEKECKCEQPETYCKNEPTIKPWEQISWGALFNFLIAAGTIGLAVYTRHLWIDTHQLVIDSKTAADHQAELIAESNRINHDTYIASARARIGTVKSAIIGEIKEGDPIKITTDYGNSGRDTAQTFAQAQGHLFRKSDWDGGATLPFLRTYAQGCVSKPIEGAALMEPEQSTFPTTSPATFTATFDSSKGPDPFAATEGLIKGTDVLVLQMCWTYKTVEEVHHTAICYFYDKANTSLTSLNYCPAGQRSD
jgi:hypothetical protein